MIDRKTLARMIDRAAFRADMIDQDPATPKQAWFLAGLILDATDEFQINTFATNTSYVLTKGRASRMIETYLQQRDA